MIGPAQQIPSASNPVAVVATARLKASPYLAIRKLACEYHEGILVLRGCLHRYFYKQLAQEAVARIDNVTQVVNQIEVTD